MQWQANFKFTTFIPLTSEVYLPVMLFNNLFHITQAESETFHIVNITRRHPVEFIKNPFLVFRGDAYAIICYLYDDLSITVKCGDQDIRFIPGIFDSVIHKVRNNVGNVYRLNRCE